MIEVAAPGKFHFQCSEDKTATTNVNDVETFIGYREKISTPR